MPLQMIAPRGIDFLRAFQKRKKALLKYHYYSHFYQLCQFHHFTKNTPIVFLPPTSFWG